MTPVLWIWAIAALTTAGVVVRPWRLPEAVWAVLGAAALALSGLVPPGAVVRGLGDSVDVCLFLAGMMLLSETARKEGLFDWLAAAAVNQAGGSTSRLFLLVYAIGVLITAVLSNDATAVVLTPAVWATARAARAEPLPLLFCCAFVANAASFLLPISNPANLVLFGAALPPLGAWLSRFALPSAAAIVATFVMLRWIEAPKLGAGCAARVDQPALGVGGRVAAVGLGAAALALMVVSAAGWPFGWPTFALGALTVAVVTARARQSPWPILKHVSWGVLPLVAGLFVIVQALEGAGLTGQVATALGALAHRSEPLAAALAGGAVALGGNLINNLPAGLLARSVVALSHAAPRVADATLIGVDLGPNLSITGSLATILWLTALRREGLDVGFWRFLRLGAAVMPPALILAIAARLAWP